MPHTLAQVKQFSIKSKPLIRPTINVFNRVIVPEFVCGRMGAIILVPRHTKINLHPIPYMEGPIFCGKEIYSVRMLFPDCCIIPSHKFKHRVMQCNIVLGGAFGETNIKDGMRKVDIFGS